jgi:uncharacterized caspase-like protein
MVMVDVHALLIGITQYQRVAPAPANHDAEDLAAVLQDPCGYPAGSIRVLRDADATRDAIYAALDQLARETTAASTVLIYYSGHGAHADHDYYLVPVEAEAATSEALARTAISNVELAARLARIPAGRLTLVLDCCRAAGMAEASLSLGEVIAPLAQGRGRVVIAASHEDGNTQVLPGRRDSSLTSALIEGLRSAVTAIDGAVLVLDLFVFIQAQVAQAAIPQHPVLKAALEVNYPIATRAGGEAAPLVIPPAPDSAAYDAYVSYNATDADDQRWISTTLVPALERLGLRLYLDNRDFALGSFTLDQEESAVQTSRYTIALCSPSYLTTDAARLEEQMATRYGLDRNEGRVIPLIRNVAQLPLHLHVLPALDISRDAEVPAALKRLAVALRQPVRPHG